MSRAKFRNTLRGVASSGRKLTWIAAIVFVTVAMAVAADSGKQATKKSSKAKKKPVKELTGAQLYAINCARCHKERYPTERTDAQWQTIILHMRVHANLPGASARKIVNYLKNAN